MVWEIVLGYWLDLPWGSPQSHCLRAPPLQPLLTHRLVSSCYYLCEMFGAPIVAALPKPLHLLHADDKLLALKCDVKHINDLTLLLLQVGLLIVGMV